MFVLIYEETTKFLTSLGFDYGKFNSLTTSIIQVHEFRTHLDYCLTRFLTSMVASIFFYSGKLIGLFYSGKLIGLSGRTGDDNYYDNYLAVA